jgi:uncharacterized membrane protein HdeD (DUF308 family)
MRRDGRTDIVATRSAPTGTSFAARTPDQWGWLAAAGILGIIVGVIALFFPGLTILTAAFFLGIVLVVQGVVEIAAAIRAGSGAAGRWWLIAFGVLALVAGVLVVFHPGGGILVMVWGLILWFIIAGANDFTAAAVSRERRVWNIAMGVFSLVAALVLIVSPATAVGVLALVIALGFIFRGVAELGLALTMRRAAR